jgi:hypothetical protein
MIQTRKTTPRAEYRLLQRQRIDDSPVLALKFPKLKTLSLDLEYFDANGVTRNGGMKYQVNVEHAKSLFCFACPNGECVGGDFDLTEALAQAIAGGQKLVTGEARCPGVRHIKARKIQVPCQNILRYKLTLKY